MIKFERDLRTRNLSAVHCTKEVFKKMPVYKGKGQGCLSTKDVRILRIKRTIRIYLFSFNIFIS